MDEEPQFTISVTQKEAVAICYALDALKEIMRDVTEDLPIQDRMLMSAMKGPAENARIKLEPIMLNGAEGFELG